jgi:hypothetical protein
MRLLQRKSEPKLCFFNVTSVFVLLQNGFKMFLGVTPVITNWSAASDEFSLILDNNPLSDFAELPDGLEGLLYSNILCGVLRGALEMVS